MFTLLVSEEILDGITIVDTQYNRPELQIETGGDPHGIGGEILHAESDIVVLHLWENSMTKVILSLEILGNEEKNFSLDTNICSVYNDDIG